MQITSNYPYGFVNFRKIGFVLFLCGAYYHCIDFLGSENTNLWGMGLTFLALMLISIGYWFRYALKRKFWRFFI